MRVAPWILLALVAMVCVAMTPALAQYPQGGDAPAGNQTPDPYAGPQNPMQQQGGQGQGGGEITDILPTLQPGAEPLMTPRQHDEFADRVDVSPLRKLAVFHGGRAKIFDTLARETLQNIHGRTRYERPKGDPRYLIDPSSEITIERDPEIGERKFDSVFTFLDLVFNPEHYLNRPLVYVSHNELREMVVSPLPESERERLKREGRVPIGLVFHEANRPKLEQMQADGIRSKQLNQVLAAANIYMNAGNTLNVVSPEPGDEQQYWPHVRELAAQVGDDSRADAANDAAVQFANYAVGSGDAEMHAQVVQTVRDLSSAWRQADAPAVNLHIERLAELLPQVHPETYPPEWRRSIEYFYNATHRFTVSYIAYFGAFVALLLAFATQWRRALLIGGLLLGVGFVGHSLGLVTRIVLSDRPWTIHNQFESFFMLTWFAALAGLILLVVKRQWIFGAAAAGTSAIMLMVANQRPIPSQEISPVPAILNTSNILYVHVNIMIISYALIALALIIALFYLFTYYSSSNTALRLAAAGVEPTGLSAATNTGDTMAYSDEGDRSGRGGDAHISAGAQAAAEPTAAQRGRAALLNDLDQAQMVIVQMVFWLLAVGILLGAYWADHSWGRWWAWDPKETWALILWIVFLVTVHLRIAVKRRGLVTAWLCVFGFFMMLWTHWGVNLLLAGLHSYA